MPRPRASAIRPARPAAAPPPVLYRVEEPDGGEPRIVRYATTARAGRFATYRDADGATIRVPTQAIVRTALRLATGPGEAVALWRRPAEADLAEARAAVAAAEARRDQALLALGRANLHAAALARQARALARATARAGGRP